MLRTEGQFMTFPRDRALILWRMRQRRLFLRRALNNHWEHDRAT